MAAVSPVTSMNWLPIMCMVVWKNATPLMNSMRSSRFLNCPSIPQPRTFRSGTKQLVSNSQSRRSTAAAYRIMTSWISARSASSCTAAEVSCAPPRGVMVSAVPSDVGDALDLDEHVRRGELVHRDQGAGHVELAAVELAPHLEGHARGGHVVSDVQSLVNHVVGGRSE